MHSFIHSFIHPSIHPSTHSFLHSSIHSFLHSSIHSFFHSFNHLSVHSCVRLVVCWDSTFPQHLMHEAISIPCMRRSCLPDSCSLMSPCNSTTPWQSQAHSQQAINCVPPLCSFFTHALGCRVLPWFCTVKIRPITNLLGSSCPVESAVSCDGQSVILTSMLVRALKVEVCGQSKPFSTQHSCPAAARIKPACQPGKHDHYQASKQACKQASKQERINFPF